ncbi:unnamed protein product [Dicrocoelium dendriticum]|nr:unnamed protein product [Dicrocoelium dendriticum]
MNGVQLWGRILTVEYSRSYPKSSVCTRFHFLPQSQSCFGIRLSPFCVTSVLDFSRYHTVIDDGFTRNPDCTRSLACLFFVHHRRCTKLPDCSQFFCAGAQLQYSTEASREMALRSILNPVQTALWPTMTPSAPVIPPRSRSFSSSARSSSRSTDRCSSSSSSYCSRRYSPGSRSRSSCSRRSCSCCSRSRERRRRSTIDSRSHSRRSVSSRGARRSVSGSIDRKSRRKPRSTGPTSEGEVTDFDDDDLSGSDTSLGDIPDSVVIAANLMHSPPSSVSLYSASSRSSSFSTPRKRKRSKEGKRCRSRFSSRYSSTRSSTGASRHSRRR